MGGLLLRLRTWWETADRTQKSVTTFGGSFLVILLFGVYFFASKPKMSPFLVGITPQQAGVVAEELRKKGVVYEFDSQGNILVPAGKIPELTAELGASGKLPAGAHLGNEDLNKIGMTDGPQVERDKLKAILEGKLAAAIETMQGVQSAKVMITLGDQSVFASEAKPPTASIQVGESPGSQVSSDQARSIANMVANSVSGLKLDNVFVLNGSGQSLFDGADLMGTGGKATRKIDAERLEAARRERELQATFDQSFGPGATIVKVNLVMDFDDVVTESDKPEVAENPVTAENATEEMPTAKGTGSIAGLGANGASPSESNSTDSKGYKSKQDKKEWAYGRTTTKTNKALGEIKSMSIAVLANSDKKVDAASVEEYLKGYLGGKSDDPNWQVQVTSVKFDDSGAKAAKDSAAAAASSAKMQQIISLVPIFALMLVGFMVVKSIAKATKSSGNLLVGALPGGHVVALGTAPSALPEGQSGYVDSYEPGTVEEVGVDADAPILTPRKKRRKVSPGEPEDDIIEDVGSIKERMNKPLEQIKKLSSKKPETVAMLIKSWLLEEKK